MCGGRPFVIENVERRRGQTLVTEGLEQKLRPFQHSESTLDYGGRAGLASGDCCDQQRGGTPMPGVYPAGQVRRCRAMAQSQQRAP